MNWKTESSDGPLASLAEFLRVAVFLRAEGVTILALERPAGGASWETFFARLSVRRDGLETTERVVIRRAPASGAMAPYEIGKDVVILGALAGSEVPVPRLLASTEDGTVFERPFTVTSFVEGESPDLTKVERWPLWQQSRDALGRAIVDVAASLARFRWQQTAVASVMGPSGGAAVRVAWTIDRYQGPLLETSRAHSIPQPFCRDVGMWLKENVEDMPEEHLSLVHGDFRFGNFVFEGTEIVALVDWERAMLGDQMSNLGFLCMPMSRRECPELMGKAITFAELVRCYEEKQGLEVSLRRLQYYMIFWQFLEFVNSARNVVETVLGRRADATSRGLVAPNLLMRQTLRLIDAFDSGRHDML